jgi:hypothetical protein
MISRRTRIAKIATIAGAVIAFGGLLLSALHHVATGSGADTYQNVYGLSIHYTSVLITFGALLAALVAGLLLRLRDFIAARRLKAQVDSKIASIRRES